MNKKIVRVITALLALVMVLMVAAPSLTTVFADIDEEMSYLAGQYQDLQNAHKQLEEEIKATNDKIADKKNSEKKDKRADCGHSGTDRQPQ